MNDTRQRTLVWIFLVVAYVVIAGNFIGTLVTAPAERGAALPGAYLCCLFVANVALVLAQRVRSLEKRLVALEQRTAPGQ